MCKQQSAVLTSQSSHELLDQAYQNMILLARIIDTSLKRYYKQETKTWRKYYLNRPSLNWRSSGLRCKAVTYTGALEELAGLKMNEGDAAGTEPLRSRALEVTKDDTGGHHDSAAVYKCRVRL